MRRYNVTEAPLSVLLDDIAKLIERDEHLNPERTDRIEAYCQAAAELEAGATEVRARLRIFRVAGVRGIRNSGIVEGGRQEIMDELDKYGADREQQGKRDKAHQFAKALTYVGRGSNEVEVEDVLYRVVED